MILGAGDENRTRDMTLARSHFTPKLHPHGTPARIRTGRTSPFERDGFANLPTGVRKNERLAYKARYGIVLEMVREVGFELTISCSQSRRFEPD